MAIRCMNPNTVSSEAEEMYNITNTQGRNVINSCAATIESLKKNWIGTDAVANLGDLSKAYAVVTEFIKDLQKLIVVANNTEILPLQKHINASAGSCTVGNELSFALNIDSFIEVPTEALESRTEPGIIADAETFNTFPDDLNNFITALDDAKEVFLNNWLDGGNRAEVVAKFNEFKGSYETLLPKIKQVRDNLNTVAENKKQFM